MLHKTGTKTMMSPLLPMDYMFTYHTVDVDATIVILQLFPLVVAVPVLIEEEIQGFKRWMTDIKLQY